MDIEGHRSTVAPCPDIASLQIILNHSYLIGRSDSRSPWLPRNKIADKQNCTMSLWPRFVAEFGHLASQSIKNKHWLLWKLTLQSDLITKAITKNWRLVWWDLLLRCLLAALHQTNKVVEKDPSKNWFKLPGKPVGKWEIELYRKQTAWDSDSNLRVPKAHELWQSAPSLAHIYTHFTIISSNRSRLLRLLLCSCCVHRVEHHSAQKRRLGLFNRHLATDLRQSKSNYDFCENCSSLDRWRLLKIGLVRYPCQKEVSEFQGISSQSIPSRRRPFIFE